MKTIAKKIYQNTLVLALELEKQKQVYMNKLRFENDPDEIKRLNTIINELDKTKDLLIKDVL